MTNQTSVKPEVISFLREHLKTTIEKLPGKLEGLFVKPGPEAPGLLVMLRDRVLVKPIERKLSEIIEVKNTDKFSLGTVMAKGPKATDIEVGDTIRFGEFSFPEWKGPDGVTYQIIQEADVACVVEA